MRSKKNYSANHHQTTSFENDSKGYITQEQSQLSNIIEQSKGEANNKDINNQDYLVYGSLNEQQRNLFTKLQLSKSGSKIMSLKKRSNEKAVKQNNSAKKNSQNSHVKIKYKEEEKIPDNKSRRQSACKLQHKQQLNEIKEKPQEQPQLSKQQSLGSTKPLEFDDTMKYAMANENLQSQYSSVNLQQQSDPDEPLNIEVQPQPKKTSVELLTALQAILSDIEHYNQKSFDYLVGIDLEIDLKRSSNNTKYLQIPGPLYLKLTNYIADQESKLQEIKNSPQPEASQLQYNSTSVNKQDSLVIEQQEFENQVAPRQVQTSLGSPKPPQKKQLAKQQAFQGIGSLDLPQKSQYDSLLQSYENSLGLIMAKDVLRFKTLSGKGRELHVGLALLYFLVSFETTIMLTNDRKAILSQSWEEVKKQFSNGGKLIFSLKKLRDYIENDLVSNCHLVQICSLLEQLSNSLNGQEDYCIRLFSDFIINAAALTKFIKQVRGVTEDKLKTPNRPLRTAAFKSPDNKTKTPFSPVKSAQSTVRLHGRIMSPRTEPSDAQKEFKKEINAQLFKQETQNLIKQAEKRHELQLEKLNLMNIQNTVSKIKFELSREEKLAQQEQEKQQLQEQIQFEQEQMQREQALLKEKQQREKQEQQERAQQLIKDKLIEKELKRQEEEQQLKDLYDFEKEQQFKREQEKKIKEEEKNLLEYKQKEIKEKERVVLDSYKQEKLSEQKERELERKKQLKTEMEALKKKQKALQQEIEFLKKIKCNPIKLK